MMLQKIKNKIFLKCCKNEADLQSGAKSFVNYQKAKNILILFESDVDEVNQDIKNIIKGLKNDGKSVQAFGVVDKKISESPELNDFQILNLKSFEWNGKPNSDLIQLIQSKNYDWVLDLSVLPNIKIQYLLLFSKAKFKSGLKKDFSAPLDFLIDFSNIETTLEGEHSTPDINYLYNQIIFYLKKIQTSD